MMGTGALAHLRVIDLTRLRSGPTCVRQFADWGADVIKVEQPSAGDDGFGPRDGGDFQNLHRNKRSLTLNLKDPRGLAVLKKLVATTDVLVENYRPAVKQRLGIDYATLSAENPRLIYASISGFGEEGPYRDRAGFDQIAQGMGGLMWTTGNPGEGPLRAGTAIADMSAGLFAALGKPKAGQQMALFADRPEILSVYHKPVPACNFAQTPSLAALDLTRTTSLPAQRILAITVRVPRAGARYPGCDYRGPFAHILQAKMSIQYNVAAALLLGSMTEHNFTLLDDAELHRLISVTQLEIDETMTAAYPARQGGEVIVHEMGGAIHRSRLDNVINATTAAVRSRFRSAVEEAFGAARAETIERAINELERSEDAGELARSLRANTVASAEHPR